MISFIILELLHTKICEFTPIPSKYIAAQNSAPYNIILSNISISPFDTTTPIVSMNILDGKLLHMVEIVIKVSVFTALLCFSIDLMLSIDAFLESFLTFLIDLLLKITIDKKHRKLKTTYDNVFITVNLPVDLNRNVKETHPNINKHKTPAINLFL